MIMPKQIVALLLALSATCFANTATADETTSLTELLRKLDHPDLIHTAIGVTRRGTPIECVIHREDLDLHTKKLRVLLIGGADGDQASVDATLAAVQALYQSPAAAEFRKKFVISAVPCLNPDGLALGKGPSNAAGGAPTGGYPPQGDAYNSETDPEAAYLWRWIGMHAPDLVVEVRTGQAFDWQVAADAPPALARLAERLGAVSNQLPADALVERLSHGKPADVGSVPALLLSADRASPGLFEAIVASGFRGPSPARQELQRRLDRTPQAISRELLDHYGKELKNVVYIPALAVIGRLRYWRSIDRLDSGALSDIEQVAAPYFRGDKPSAPTSGSGLSGHLVFCEFAELTSGQRRARYIELARAAGDLAFEDDGRIKPVMPFHLEMSDSVFMGGPILARVGSLTGEARYFDACARHLRFLREVDLRDDGLYRHSPLDEAAWGRGNGFPAIGLAMCLSHFPPDHPDRAELLRAFQEHMAALARHQDPTGCWHQVIDRPESYRELSSTCMITFAMARGVNRGWLDAATYQPAIDRGWYAIRTRIGSEGQFVDVCTGTGKQRSLRDYYDRTAILGRDARGGAMALLVANEIGMTKSE